MKFKMKPCEIVNSNDWTRAAIVCGSELIFEIKV